MRIVDGKVTYIVEKLDDYNFRLIKEYVSKAKGHVGKIVHGEAKYYPSLERLLSSLAKKKIETAMVMEENLKKTMKQIEKIIKESAGGRF